LNNPLKYIDPSGQKYSPYFNINGKHLGNDEKGWSGNIYITTQDAFNQSATGDVANSENIQANSATRPYNTALADQHYTLTPEAESRIATTLLQNLQEADLSNLYNGEISVLAGTANNGRIGVGHNDPEPSTGRLLFDKTANGQYRVTAKSGELKSLGTVEAVWSYMWVHELLGHGILKIPGKENPKAHQQAYRNQFNHSTFEHLSTEQQTEIINRMNGK